jgi:hypothetical protein
VPLRGANAAIAARRSRREFETAAEMPWHGSSDAEPPCPAFALIPGESLRALY